MRLEYVRKPDHVDGGVIPLPEGWPAADHNEPDRKIAQSKLDSGRYRKAERLTRSAGDEGERPTIHPHNEIQLASPPEEPEERQPAQPAEPVKEG